MISLNINGKNIDVELGTTVMEAALKNEIDIPRLCYHPDLTISGNCRLCLVEVDGWQKPVTSCELICQEGMIIRTQSETLTKLRRQTIDFFLIDHPLDCVICEKAGSCLLQAYAYEYGLKETSHDFILSRTLYQKDNPFFLRDHKYCILCRKVLLQ